MYIIMIEVQFPKHHVCGPAVHVIGFWFLRRDQISADESPSVCAPLPMLPVIYHRAMPWGHFVIDLELGSIDKRPSVPRFDKARDVKYLGERQRMFTSCAQVAVVGEEGVDDWYPVREQRDVNGYTQLESY